MNIGKIHKYLGLVLLLPLAGWAITGAVFITKPGYSGAYEQVGVKTYSQEALKGQPLPIDAWHEVRLLRTVLGLHLLEKKDGAWRHLNGANGQPWSQPSNENLIRLLEDAISMNPERYGTSVHYQEGQGGLNGAFVSSTGVRLSLNWNTLSIRQTGGDTDLINTLYKVHYLQWTGNKVLDKFFGVIGLVLLILLAAFGFKLYLRRR